jgi:DNA topoisomerase IA
MYGSLSVLYPIPAVEARQEIDLRAGCVFTRFQTKLLQNHFVGFKKQVVSFGARPV